MAKKRSKRRPEKQIDKPIDGMVCKRCGGQIYDEQGLLYWCNNCWEVDETGKPIAPETPENLRASQSQIKINGMFCKRCGGQIYDGQSISNKYWCKNCFVVDGQGEPFYPPFDPSSFRPEHDDDIPF